MSWANKYAWTRPPDGVLHIPDGAKNREECLYTAIGRQAKCFVDNPNLPIMNKLYKHYLSCIGKTTLVHSRDSPQLVELGNTII